MNTVWHRLHQTQSSLFLIQTSISCHVTGSGSKTRNTCMEANALTPPNEAQLRDKRGGAWELHAGWLKVCPGLRISEPRSNLFACSQAGHHQYIHVCEHEIGLRIKAKPPLPRNLRLFSSINRTRAAVNIVHILHYHLWHVWPVAPPDKIEMPYKTGNQLNSIRSVVDCGVYCLRSQRRRWTLKEC